MKAEEGCLEVRATNMIENTSVTVVTGSPSTAISVLVRSVDFQRGIRCARVDGRHDHKMIRSLSVSWVISRPSVGWSPFVFTVISMEGPKGFDESSNSTGVSIASACMIASSSSLGMMCGSAKVRLRVRVKGGRLLHDTGIGDGTVVVVAVVVVASSVDGCEAGGGGSGTSVDASSKFGIKWRGRRIYSNYIHYI